VLTPLGMDYVHRGAQRTQRRQQPVDERSLVPRRVRPLEQPDPHSGKSIFVDLATVHCGRRTMER
jgi:hypothetical protein